MPSCFENMLCLANPNRQVDSGLCSISCESVNSQRQTLINYQRSCLRHNISDYFSLLLRGDDWTFFRPANVRAVNPNVGIVVSPVHYLCACFRSIMCCNFSPVATQLWWSSSCLCMLLSRWVMLFIEPLLNITIPLIHESSKHKVSVFYIISQLLCLSCALLPQFLQLFKRFSLFRKNMFGLLRTLVWYWGHCRFLQQTKASKLSPLVPHRWTGKASPLLEFPHCHSCTISSAFSFQTVFCCI